MSDYRHENLGPKRHGLKRLAAFLRLSRIRQTARSVFSPNLRTWIILPVTMMTVLGLTAIGVYQVRQFHDALDRNAFQLAQQTQAEWKTNLRELAQVLKGRIETVVDDPAIVRAWQDGDRAALANLAEPRFDQWKRRYRLTHLYFIATDGVCRLRAYNPSRWGDQ
ncbi:MAG: hypothetical protein U1E05_13675, partial [Patescibacteria group bacterium]|nr:hypothetical protein [Patescibacteria group bacterium]